MPMVCSNVFFLVSPVTLASPSFEDAQAAAFESEGPASAPTFLVEVDESPTPTALPAPPLVPSLAGMDGWRPPPASSVPASPPALALVHPMQRFSTRPTVRVPELRSHELRIVRPSSPPTVPPPSPAMRYVA